MNDQKPLWNLQLRDLVNNYEGVTWAETIAMRNIIGETAAKVTDNNSTYGWPIDPVQDVYNVHACNTQKDSLPEITPFQEQYTWKDYAQESIDETLKQFDLWKIDNIQQEIILIWIWEMIKWRPNLTKLYKDKVIAMWWSFPENITQEDITHTLKELYDDWTSTDGLKYILSFAWLVLDKDKEDYRNNKQADIETGVSRTVFQLKNKNRAA